MNGSYSLETLEGIIAGARLYGIAGARFSEVFIDSRTISDGARGCFFALKGERHDGFHYLHDAYKKGVRCFVTNRLPAQAHADAAYLLVPDARGALQALAQHHRSQFAMPVVGITGSNGKTIVKEWLSQVLSAQHAVVRNPRSYNSQVGVPLAVLEMADHHTVGIFEAGISQPGEMHRLEPIIAPEIGVFTHFGEAHREHFANDAERAQEKCALFRGCHTVVYPAGQAAIDEALDRMGFEGKRLTFSVTDPGATGYAQRDAQHPLNATLHCDGQHHPLQFPFGDAGSVNNVLCVVLTALALGQPVRETLTRIAGLRPPEMRLERMGGRHGSVILADVWNNDLPALRLALDELNNTPGAQKNVVILSDLLQTGRAPEALFEELDRLLVAHRIDLLLGVGAQFVAFAQRFSVAHRCFASTDDLLDALTERMFAGAAVLVKGATPFRFDRVVRHLQLMVHSSVLEISMSRMVDNLNVYRARLAPGTKVMAMVKAFGYGTGSTELAAMLAYQRVDYLGVAYVHEGVALREQGITTPILVLNPDSAALPLLIAHRLEPQVFSMRILEALISALTTIEGAAPYPIHIELNTGMNRLGFDENEMGPLVERLRGQQQVHVVGVMSHLAAAESAPHDAHTRAQIAQFQRGAERIAEVCKQRPLLHLCNTAGLLRFPEAHFDMVRLGIGLYGVPSCELDAGRILPAGSFKTRISQLHTVKAGRGVGYGFNDAVAYDRVIATVPVGYADGYPRALSNGRGRALLGDHEVAVVGKVCMDMTMFDVTGTGCAEGDVVVLFGDRPTLHALAAAAGTIPYELLSGIGSRVHRVYWYG